MSAPPIPEARVEASTAARAIARLRPIGRFLLKCLPGAFVLSLVGAGIFGIHQCCVRESAEKARACTALNWKRDRVERLVRTEDGVRAYIRDDPADPTFLREYKFKDLTPFSEIVFLTDVPDGQPIRFVSTAQLDPSDQCLQRTEFHIRSARDIE
jgi:hypothetical protein